MKVIISEKQLFKIIGKKKEIDEEDKLTTSSSDTTSATAAGTSTTNDIGTSPGAADMPSYPEVDKAEDLVTRGVANPVDYTKKHEDYPEANPVRGRANPIKGM
jgi:hypothetical protein